MNWTDIIVGGLVGALVVTMFFGFLILREISRDNNYFHGMIDGTKIADQLMKISKMLEKERNGDRR